MPKLIAEVALPISIALNEHFDYSVPSSLVPKVMAGCRVLVPFRTSCVLGYVVRLKNSSDFSGKLKPVIKNLDETPILDKDSFSLAHKVQSDYFCCLADAIQAVLPVGLKRSKRAVPLPATPESARIPFLEISEQEKAILETEELKARVVLLQDLSDGERWPVYAALIKKTLNAGKSVIFLVPDHGKIGSAIDSLGLNVNPLVLTSHTKTQESLDAWNTLKTSDFSFVIGTRSAVFAPAKNLGLIILEEEDHFAYRQDQVPHYRCHEIASLRAKQEDAQLVLGSFPLSLDAYYLFKSKKAGYLEFKNKRAQPSVRIIDMRQEFRRKGRERIISKLLEYHIANTLEHKGRLLLFVNQKGFSTFLYCPKCKKTQTCPRCSSSLKYNQKAKDLSCPTCSFRETSFEICPDCRSTYVKYSGFGLEKVESEIARLFPSARTVVYEKEKNLSGDYDIMLATQGFLEDPRLKQYAFDSVCLVACDQMFSRADFRSTEKAYAKLLRLQARAKNNICLQTYVVENDALRFLAQGDTRGFLEYELKQRKEFGFPPVRQMGILNVRSRDEAKAKEQARACHEKIRADLKNCEVFEPVPGTPFKLRDNYRYQILVKYRAIAALRRTISAIIQERRHGVIVTFDPSPL